MSSNSDQTQWIQCETCARHVRARDGGCPFCARDARESSPAIRPAAIVIAAIVALAPAQSTAELRAGGAGAQRGAQAMDVQAYGAPAPAYGLAPPRVPPPSSGGVTVENVRVSGGSMAVYRAIIERSRLYGQSCARVTARTEPVSPDATVTITVTVPAANARTTPRVVVRAPRLPAGMRTCLEGALGRLPWTRPTTGRVTAQWLLRFRGVDA
jgi:hypothetical protein